MDTLQKLRKDSMKIWKDLLKCNFIKEMENGILNINIFKEYLIQDYFYLLKYKEVLSIAINKTSSIKIKELLNKYINLVTDEELNDHNNYIKSIFSNNFNINNYSISLCCSRYASYMLDLAKSSTIEAILVSIVVCAYSYEVIALNMIKNNESILKNSDIYSDWVKTYASKKYHQENMELIDLFNELTIDFNDDEIAYLCKIFNKCSQYELDLFNSFFNKENGKCLIIGASKEVSFPQKAVPNDLVIVCDGGYKNYDISNHQVDYIIGDFDSLGFIPGLQNVIVLPTEKDDTDVFYAVKFGISKGYKCFEIYSALGGEIDHLLGNIQVLNYLKERNLEGILIGNEYNIELIKNEKRIIEPQKGKISLLSYSKVCLGVTIKNLKYELNNESLSNDNPIGIRNEFIDKKAEIEVKSGTIIMIYYKK